MKDTNCDKSVSIALCTYNGSKFLQIQLDSILQQSYSHIREIICVDDNSSDSTWEILSTYAKTDSRFKIHRNSSNLGFIKNFEKALLLTTSEYIAISDQDDIWYPNKIAKLMDGIDNCMMVYSDNEYLNSQGDKMGIRFSDKRNLSSSTSCLNFALFNAISGHTMLFKRELLQKALPFPTNIHYDWWLSICASQLSSIKYIHEPLVGYRQHASNTVGGYGYNKTKKKKNYFDNETFIRITKFYETIEEPLSTEKDTLRRLLKSYTNKSLISRLERVVLFWKYRNELLLFKRRSKLRKMIYCLKVLWKYD